MKCPSKFLLTLKHMIVFFHLWFVHSKLDTMFKSCDHVSQMETVVVASMLLTLVSTRAKEDSLYRTPQLHWPKTPLNKVQSKKKGTQKKLSQFYHKELINMRVLPEYSQ